MFAAPREIKTEVFIRLREALRIAPHSPELEITESLLIDSMSGVEETLHELNSMGIALSLDDNVARELVYRSISVQSG